MTAFRTPLFAALLAVAPLAAFAQEANLSVSDAYARVSSPAAMSGAIFMTLENAGVEDDRLIAAQTDAATRAELHTHIEDANGVMRMVEVEDGIPVPAGGAAMLERGGDHVMLMGLAGPLEHGDTVTLMLRFESGEELTVAVPVDLNRTPRNHHGG